MSSYTIFLLTIFVLVVGGLALFLYVTWRGENPRVPKNVESEDPTEETPKNPTNQ